MSTRPVLMRVPTGVPGLDSILGGGLFRGGMYMIIGRPGAGKTILGNQICFAHIASGGSALFVTLLAESHARMLEHLSSLSFFSVEPLARSMSYLSGIEVFERDGLKGLLQFLRHELRARKATLLVIDGIGALWTGTQSDNDLKHFFHDLQVMLSAQGSTALLLNQTQMRHDSIEYTMVDGIVELSHTPVDVRLLRHLEVVKFRGSGYIAGQHLLTITGDGVTIYPRTEAHIGAPAPAATPRSRLPFGVAGLDTMLGGGLLSGSTTALVGAPGSGKTIAGLHFLAAGAAVGQKGLYFGFYEPPSRLIAKANDVGLGFSAAVAAGLTEVRWHAPLEQPLDLLAADLLAAVRERGVQRLVVDGINTFQQAAVHPERLGRFFTALTNELRVLNVTTIFNVETPELFGTGIQWPVQGLTGSAENIIYLRYIVRHSRLERLISILKVRDSGYDTSIHTFAIGEGGIVVGEIPAEELVWPAQGGRQGGQAPQGAIGAPSQPGAGS